MVDRHHRRVDLVGESRSAQPDRPIPVGRDGTALQAVPAPGSPVADGRHRPLAAVRPRRHLSVDEFPAPARPRRLIFDQEVAMRPRMTPLEIQKREFSRKWKGLDPLEVQQFLTDAAEDMEALARENADLDARLRSLEQENEEHRERERILKQTLLSAHEASEDIRNAAHKEGELIVREAQESGERLTHSALQRAAEIEKAIHGLKLQRTNFRLQLQKMIELFQQVLEFDRDEDDKERPLSYLTRKANKEETAG